MAKCRKCQVWEIESGDRFCGNCRAELLKITVEPARLVLFHREGMPTEQKFQITNTGQNEVIIQDIRSDVEWIEVKLQKRAESRKGKGQPIATLLSGEHISCSAGLNLSGMEDKDTIEGRILVDTNIEPEKIPIKIVPYPEIKIQTEELILVGMKEHTFKGEIKLVKGEVFIKDIKTNIDWIEPVLQSKNVSLKEGDIIEFTLTINPAELPKDAKGQPKDESDFELHILIKGTEFEPFFFKVVYHSPPEISIVGGAIVSINLYEDEEKTVRKTIENSGGHPLSIVEIESLNNDIDFIRGADNFKFPLVLQPKEAITIPFNIKTSGISPGKYNKRFLIHSDHEAFTQTEITVQLKVNPMPDYPYCLAIDYGTTNSCCAIVGKGLQAELVILKKRYSETLKKEFYLTQIPSAVYFKKLSPQIDVEVGERAYDLSFLPKYYGSVVTSLKTLLGSDKKIEITVDSQNEEFLPEEIVKFVLEYLIERSTRFLKQKIRKVMIGVPADFTLGQVIALKSACTSAGIEELEIIEEPIAAAFKFLMENKPDQPSYSLLVYDFGGGTTNITLVRVKDEYEGEKRQNLSVEVIGLGGNRNFGGNNLTEDVRELMINEFIQQDPENRKHVPYEIDEMEQDGLYEPVGFNRSQLRPMAEEMKITLSKEKVVTIGSPITIYYINKDGKIDASIMNITLDRNKFEDHIRKQIEENIKVAEKIVNDARSKGEIKELDIVLLSGGSSQVPLVREIMIEKFGKNRVKSYEDELLKTCVALGAINYYTLMNLPRLIDFKYVPEKKVTKSRIGIAIFDEGKVVFKEIIPALTPMPAKGEIRSGEIKMPLKEIVLHVYEHWGFEDDIETATERNQCQLIGFFRTKIPQDFISEANRTDRLSITIEIKDDRTVEVIGDIDGKQFNFQCERNREML